MIYEIRENHLSFKIFFFWFTNISDFLGLFYLWVLFVTLICDLHVDWVLGNVNQKLNFNQKLVEHVYYLVYNDF